MKNNRPGTLALTLLVGVLASCGGGGGGGGSGSSSSSSGGGGGGSGSVRFTPNPTSLSFEYFEGAGVPASQNIVVTASGALSGTLYLGAVATGQGLDPQLPLTIDSNTQGTFRVTAARDLPVGDHSGTLQLLACSDQACTRQVGNSPINVSYVTHVRVKLHVTPTTVNLVSQSNAGTSSDVAITLPYGSTAFTADVTSGNEFLTVSQPNSTTLRIQARAVPSGQRFGSVRVQAGDYSEVVSVSYNVTPPPGGELNLRTNPASVRVSTIERTTAAPVTIEVLGPSWEPQLATGTFIFYGSPFTIEWLQVQPVAGGYRLTANANALNAGTYTATLQISGTDTSVASNVVQVPITFTVGPGLITPADITAVIDANTTLASPVLRGSVPITLAGGPAVQWSATSSDPWVVLTRSSGTTGTSLQYEINTDALDLDDSYVQRDFPTTINITATPFLAPVSFQIKVQQRLAHINGIAPYYQVSGSPSRHIIRGTGFIANRDWSQNLRVMGVPAGNGHVTRVNDTELIVDLDASPSSGIVLDAINDLGTTPGWDPIVVLPVRTSSYQALTTGFAVKKLHYDAQRDSLWLIDETTSTARVLRYGNSGGSSWQLTSSVSLAGVKDIVVSPDNRTNWFPTTLGMAYSPADSVQINGPNPNDPLFLPLHNAPYSDSIAFTNDWKVWFSNDNGSGAGVGLKYSEVLRSQPAVPVESALLLSFEGPWFTVSGNGERVYISQSVNATPKLLALDAKDGVLFEVPNAGSFNNLRDASINMDGSRLIGTQFDVRNLAYQNIGNVEVAHQNFISVASTVNATGTRAYVLAYEQGDLSRTVPQFLPRVYVFNLTTAQAAGLRMPMLGYFTINDYPTCRNTQQCSIRPRAALAPDGKTLFFAGNAKLVITPIPAENVLMSTAAAPVLSKQGIVAQPWSVESRAH